MSIDLLLDSNNDLSLFNGDLELTDTQEEATRQYVTTQLRGFLGECFFATDQFGVPWLANDNNPIQLLGKNSSQQIIDLYIKQAITTREGIQQITSYNSVWDRANRTLSVSFTAITTSGEPLSVENILVEI